MQIYYQFLEYFTWNMYAHTHTPCKQMQRNCEWREGKNEPTAAAAENEERKVRFTGVEHKIQSQ